jgi:phosphoribosyl 1,2-cyclic phosphodiesterase
MPKKSKITFWGVRGSTAAPGPMTAWYGGNTPCVSIESGSSIIICDAGTGIRALGHDLIRRKKRKAVVLFSHLHLDHVIGLPFFRPIYEKGNHFIIMSPGRSGEGLKSSLKKIIGPPYFPLKLSAMRASLSFRNFPKKGARIGGVGVEAFKCSHPDGSYAFKFCLPTGRSLVYASDNEPSARHGPAFLRWLKETDVLIHDAQYTPAQYRGKVGWGHSPVNYPIMLAAAAGIKHLILFHYDPSATDNRLRLLEKEARRFIRRMGIEMRLTLSRESMKISI